MASEAPHLLEQILTGEFQGEGIGRVFHPAVKTVCWLLPLIFGSALLLGRMSGSPPASPLLIITFALSIGICQTLDFRNSARRPLVLWGVLTALVWFLFVRCLLGDGSAAQNVSAFLTWILVALHLQNPLHVVANWIKLDDVLVILVFALAGRGIKRMGPVDTLWFSRVVFLGTRVQALFLTVVMVFFMVHRTFGVAIDGALTAARSKARILKNGGMSSSAIRAQAANLFLKKLLRSLFETVYQANTLLRERGFFVLESRSVKIHHLTVEDGVASTFLLVASLVVVAAYSVGKHC